MSVQVRRRREAAAFLATFVGAQGELLVDTTNNRVQVHDGVTAGGWPAAKLADVVGRTTVADAAYTAKATDRTIAVTSLTAARTITLPAASAFPTGTTLTIVDESGACATLVVGIAAAGTDTINGVAVWPIATAYGYVALESNGTGRWTVIDGPGTGRTAVADAAYAALVTDRTIAYTALSAARVVSLPAASAYPTGTQLVVIDESGACSATLTLTLARAGSDTINGAASAVIALPYGYIALESNGTSKWTVIDQSTASLAQQAASAVVITGGTIDNTSIGNTTAVVGKFTKLTVSTQVLLPSYTVATLPAAVNAGLMVFCTNARMQTSTAGVLEASGSGTGGLVTANGSAWKIAGTNITVSA